MNKLLRALLPLLSLVSSASAATDNLSPHRQATFLGGHLSFQPNVGQADPSASFISSEPSHFVQLAPNHVTFRLAAKSIQMNLQNASQVIQLQGESLLPGKANYFPDRDKTHWHSNIPTYERVTERDIYPGIDLAFYGNPDRFEYDFAIQPNASVAAIHLTFTGTDHATITSQGDLSLEAGTDQLSLLKPVAYQLGQDGKSRNSVEASYRLNQTTGLITFAVGPYDHTRPLIIDPVLSYSQYLSFVVDAATSDSTGNIYLVSGSWYTESTITKLSPTGTVLYTTTFGTGSLSSSVAVDSEGRAYIAGQTASNSTLPVSSKSYRATLPVSTSAFFAEVSADGASIPYATFLGGSDYSNNQANGIAVDPTGNAYLVGVTASASFPTTPGAYQTVNPANSSSGFVAKFNPALSGKASLVYSTLIGTPDAGGSPSGTFLNGSSPGSPHIITLTGTVK